MSSRIFVTGATGYVGSAIALRLARAGHEVYGLTRSREAAAALERAGIKPVVGDLARSAGFLQGAGDAQSLGGRTGCRGARRRS